eukprot:2052516-Amphidinium_carterae.1
MACQIDEQEMPLYPVLGGLDSSGGGGDWDVSGVGGGVTNSCYGLAEEERCPEDVVSDVVVDIDDTKDKLWMNGVADGR